ncbi:MAG: hypothetical protein QOG23_4676 [Blastocatellia bacterium]|nr:hypothetical protein [Blastocatellia bacterium]
MHNCKRFLMSFLILSLVAGLPGAQTRKPTMVFAVSAEAGEGSMDAVVVVDGKRLRAPFTDDQKDRQKKIAAEYFAAGRTYRLIFGGGEAGSVRVKKWSEGCNSVHAEVSVPSSTRLGGNVRALATNSDLLGKKPSARRAPTDAERSAVMLLMKGIYTQHRTPGSLIPSIKVTNLTATDLDGDGIYEMIGSFTLAAPDKFERDLFLIAKPWGLRVMRAEFENFQAYQPPPEQFLHSIDFVDQLDLDGNGTGEVFAVQGGFDAYAYLIFKKVGGRWRQVYDMIGDAC